MKRLQPTRRYSAIIIASELPRHFASSNSRFDHPLMGQPVLGHILERLQQMGCDPIQIARLKARARAVALLAGTATGTREIPSASAGEAVAACLKRGAQDADAVLVVAGDLPLVRLETLQAILDEQRAHPGEVALLTTWASPLDRRPAIKRDAGGGFLGLGRPRREPGEVAVEICACSSALLRKASGGKSRPGTHAQLVARVLTIAGSAVRTVPCAAEEVLKIEDRLQLAAAARWLRVGINRQHMLAGVTMEDPATTHIDRTVRLGRDVTLGADVQLRGHCRVGDDVTVEPHVVAIDCVIDRGAQLRAFSHLEDARVRAGAIIGPFARLRPLADIGEEAHIGNFVEVKKSVIEPGAKANHLAYLGDARVGSKANVGAGTICCNYDGAAKHHTDIGRSVFIGSNSTLVAPITIRDGAYVAAGSTLTIDVPADALAFGRARQSNKMGLATRLRERIRQRSSKPAPPRES